ncbi:MAG: sugar phosphate isomerase/epimerase [Acidobacteriaceae bacterium]|nr:sugar phosphate isomerase/epimerase [Acidobacteriaceae bacterium]MBV9938897.1 sugar phosphate isomerase/epimerase [Acidobacteriaceae bacterium]
MNRREFLAVAAAAAPLTAAGGKPNVKLGIDLFSLRAQNWTPLQYLDYCAERKVQVVHFSEIRFIGGLAPENLRAVREHAAKLGLEVEIGMKSICPTSKMFDPKEGTAEEQLGRMMEAANIVGSPIVRAVLGSADDRKPGPIEARIEDTVKVLRNVRSKVLDHHVKIAIENHAGDMQARELKMLVEEAGTDFVGVCLDSGNPLWTLEDPHLTLEVLHPYVLTSHLRDSAVWKVPQGAAVTWVQMGRGNVGINSYVRKYIELCPGRPLSLESILFGPRILPYWDQAFWAAYGNARASEFVRYLKIAESGKPYRNEPWETKDEAQREREALDESLQYLKKLTSGA